jgi:predicted CoA-substrate-specific enzyme activase
VSYYAGIDLGSISSEAVVLEDGDVDGRCVIRTRADQKETAEEALRTALPDDRSADEVDYIVSTGYGRTKARNSVADEEVTEITAQCRGIASKLPETDLVIDVGGQDTKVIRHDGDGGVDDFRLNEKCAAGTGRFIEVLADALDVSLEVIGDAKVEDDPSLSSYCTVFAESEVISLRSEGYAEPVIASAVNRSFANKVAGQAKRLHVDGDTVAVTGGMALNGAFVAFLEGELETDVHVPDSPQTTCAYGSALIARQRAARPTAEAD